MHHSEAGGAGCGEGGHVRSALGFPALGAREALESPIQMLPLALAHSFMGEHDAFSGHCLSPQPGASSMPLPKLWVRAGDARGRQ